jgi:hypothetical protein
MVNIGTLRVSLSDIRGNSAIWGAGIWSARKYDAPDVWAHIVASHIGDNRATVTGGGIDASHHLWVVDTAVVDNSAQAHGGGGIYFGGGFLRLEGVTLARNAGSTALSVEGFRGEKTVINSTISDNGGEGVVATDGAVVGVVNSTIADNGDAAKRLPNIAANIAVGQYGEVVRLVNSIVAGAPAGVSNCSGPLSGRTGVMSLGHNLSDDDSCGLDRSKGDLFAVEPLLAALGHNGGRTETRALLAASPARDAADAAACPARDQRSAARPHGPDCDIGAYEAGAIAPLPLAPEIESCPRAQPRLCVCGQARQELPPSVIQDALAKPERYAGWGALRNPTTGASLYNPTRQCLTLHNPNLAYHPQWNAPVWRSGCP